MELLQFCTKPPIWPNVDTEMTIRDLKVLSTENLVRTAVVKYHRHIHLHLHLICPYRKSILEPPQSVSII